MTSKDFKSDALNSIKLLNRKTVRPEEETEKLNDNDKQEIVEKDENMTNNQEILPKTTNEDISNQPEKTENIEQLSENSRVNPINENLNNNHPQIDSNQEKTETIKPNINKENSESQSQLKNKPIESGISDQIESQKQKFEEKEVPNKKMTFADAKKEIDEFTRKVDQLSTELYQKYNINIADFNYDRYFPEDFSISIIEEYFKDKKVPESNQKI
jgi:hypothetical protein